MLSLERAMTVDGISVFRDHADPNQFWCLPGPVTLARREGDNQPAISFLKYKPAVADGGVKGGGFAMIETTCQLSPQREARIKAALASQPGVTDAVLATAPFETGTVQCIALNLQGSAGTSASAAPAGAFNAVEEILGATTPSLDAQNRAAFSLTLSQEGATILAQAFSDGLAPIGVVYSLTYSAMRPAINVEIKADYERIFQQFSASLEGQYMFFRAGLEAAFEQLKQTGAIEIKVFDFTGEADEKEKEKWALDFFRDQLLTDWFGPTLTPGKITGQEAVADPLSEVVGLGRSMMEGTPAPGPTAARPATPGQPAAPGQPTTPPTGAPGTSGARPVAGAPGTAGVRPATGVPPVAGTGTTTGVQPPAGTRPVAGAVTPPGAPTTTAAPRVAMPGVGVAMPGMGAARPAPPVGRPSPPVTGATPPIPGAGTATATAARAPAVLTPDSANAAPGAGRSVTHVPAPGGTSETITVAGAGAQVTVDGAPVALSPAGTATVDVPAGGAKQISVTWPAGRRAETFHLFFDFDEPAAANWSATPPSADYRAYVADNNPADSRFLDASGVSDGTPAGSARPWTGSERGGERLTGWLRTLAQPRAVTVDAHASFETAPQSGSSTAILPDAERADHNMRLSIRRADVAIGICGRERVTLSQPAGRHGDQQARGDAANPATGDPNDRVVKIVGQVGDGDPATWRGSIARLAAPVTPTPVTPTPGQPMTPPTPGQPATPPTPGQPATPRAPAQPTTPAQPGTAGRPATPGTTPAAAKPMTTNIAVSLKLRFVRQEERKVVTFRYNRAEAVKRVYAPQGFVGLMLDELDDPKRFMSEIDLDDPFFRKFEIVAEAPGDFARMGLGSVQAAVDYGDPRDASGVKHHDFLFRPGDQGPAKHSFFLSEDRDLEYSLIRQFHFDPASGWDAEATSYEIPAQRTADRTLLVSPSDILDFLEVGVEPGDIDKGIVERIEATLTIDEPEGFARSSTFTLLPGSAPQSWKVRVRKPADPAAPPRRLSYSLRHHLKGGAVREEGPFETTAGRIIVHDPFPAALEITLLPLFGDTIAQAFAEIEYEDQDNDYVRSERVSAKGDATDPVTVRLALLDDKKRDFRVRFTFVTKDQQIREGAFFTPDRTIVGWRP